MSDVRDQKEKADELKSGSLCKLRTSLTGRSEN
jgi:hypothetical protein